MITLKIIAKLPAVGFVNNNSSFGTKTEIKYLLSKLLLYFNILSYSTKPCVPKHIPLSASTSATPVLPIIL